jgi:hypothetical protein
MQPMDQYYYEEGYIDEGYHVYIGEALIDLRPYIEEGYIDPSYYEYYGISSSLTGELSKVEGEVEEASASLSSAFAQTLQAVKTVDAVSTQSTQFIQTATPTRIMQIAAEFTAAFSPVMTVSAIKNSFAVLDATTSISVDAEANRAANITLESIVNQSLTGDRFRDYASAQTATATQSTAASKSVVTSSTQSSAFSVTATLGGPARATANLASKFQLLTAKYINGQRPITLTPVSSSSGNDYGFCTDGQLLGGSRTGRVKYGTHAYYLGSSTNARLISKIDETFVPKANEQFVFEFWRHHLSGTSALTSQIYANLGADAGSGQDMTDNGLLNTNAFAIGLFRTSLGDQILRASIQTANNTWLRLTSTFPDGRPIAPSGQFFFHVVLRRGSDGVIRLLLNGNQIASANYSGAFFIQNPAVNSRIGLYSTGYNVPSPGGVIFDEVSYRIGRSEVTGSTSSIVNDPDTQKLLFHFDNTLNDDVSVTYSMQAALNSIASVTARLTGSVFAESNLTATSSVNADSGILKNANSAISSEFTQLTVINKIRSTDATFSAEFAQTTNADVTRTFDSDLNSDFAQTAVATRIQESTASFDVVASKLVAAAKVGDFLIACDVVATQSTDAVKTTDVTSIQSAEFTQTADGIKAVESSGTLVGEFAASVQTRRIAGLVSDQNSDFTQVSTVNYTADADSNQIANTSLSADAAGSTVGFSSDLNSEFAQNLEFDRFRNSGSVQSSEFTQVADTDNSYVRGADATLSSDAEISAEALRIFDSGVVAFEVVASKLAAVAKIGDFLIAADVISTLNADIRVIASGVTALDAEFTQTADVAKNAVSSADVSSEFTQVTVAIKAVNATGNFNSEFALTADVVKSTDAIVVKAGEFTQTADAVKTASGNSDLEAFAFKLSVGDRTRDTSAALSAEFDQSTVASKITGAEINISSAFTPVMNVNIIHIVDAWTYKIKRENRQFNIKKETRSYKIKEA